MVVTEPDEPECEWWYTYVAAYWRERYDNGSPDYLGRQQLMLILDQLP